MEKTEILSELTEILGWIDQTIIDCVFGENNYRYPIEKSISKDTLKELREKVIILGNKVYKDVEKE